MFCADINGESVFVLSKQSDPKPLDSEGSRLRCEVAAELRRRQLGDYYHIARLRGKRLKHSHSEERILLRIIPRDQKQIEEWFDAVKSAVERTEALACDSSPRRPERQANRHVARRRTNAYAA
jgi:hypothetical protein